MSARFQGRGRLTTDTCWAQSRDDIEAVVLVGSFAREGAGMASDVDLVILTPNFAQLAAHPNWFLQLRPGSQLIHAMAWGTPARAPLPDAQRTAGRRRSGASGLAELPLDPGTQRVLTMGTPCFGTHEDSYFVPAKCSTAVARRPTLQRAPHSGRGSTLRQRIWRHAGRCRPGLYGRRLVM